MASISAFVERWQPETNSFHMPFGKMTITLDDVSQILRIPVVGMMLSFEGSGWDITSEHLVQLMKEELGIDEKVTEEETMGTYAIGLDWLKQQMQRKDDVNSEEGYDLVARGYLLYTILKPVC